MRRAAVVYLLLCVLATVGIAAEEVRSKEDGATQPASRMLALRIYADQLDPATLDRVTYGYDRDAVCRSGVCDDGSTPCTTNAACTGQTPTELCNYTACTGDFSPNCDPPNDICGVLVEDVAGGPVGQTVWELVCDPVTPGGTDCQVGSVLPATSVSWDFSSITSFSDLVETASTVTPIDSTETPNFNACGFSQAGAVLGREDKDYDPDPADAVHTLNSLERENDVKVCYGGNNDGAICVDDGGCTGSGTCTTTSTIWLRGVVRYEGIGGGLGEGESRVCYVTGGRTEVPLWRFPNEDVGNGLYYMELGDDRWQHTAFSCEPIITFPVAVKATPASGFESKQTGEVVNEGVLKLPSGHQFHSLVVRSVAEYSVFIDLIVPCAINVDSVRTVNYLWEVPHLGTIVRLQSDKIAPDDLISHTHLAEIDIKYGLFPPLSVSVEEVTDTAVRISWNPGSITDHIDGYRVYWGQDSGGSCLVGGEDCNADHPGAGNCPAGKTCCGTPADTCQSYASNSVDDPTDVVFDTTTSATISGLDPSATHYLTVTAMSDFEDPASLVTTSYESVLYPTQIPATPVDLPIEVSGATGASCAPTTEVPEDMIGNRVGTGAEFCWTATADPCIDGYRILGAPAPESAANFATEVDTGLATCKTLTSANTYFLVVGKDAGGTGLWGHYGM